MSLKLYLHDAGTGDSGSLPGATSLSGVTATVKGTNASVNKSLSAKIGTSQTTQTVTSSATTSAQTNWYARFLSTPLAAQTIAALTWTISFAALEANINANTLYFFRLYSWRPSDGSQQTIFTASANSAEPGTSQTALSTTGTGSSVTVAAGDILVLEVWSNATQGNATARLNTFCYDGTTEASTTSCASFLSTTAVIPYGALITDTGLSVTDSIARRVSRSISDTGLSVTDSITPTKSRWIGDWGIGSPASPALIRENLASTAAGGSTTQNFTIAQASSAGHILVLAVALNSTGLHAPAITDSKGNTWTSLATSTDGGNHSVVVMYATPQNVAPLTTSDTITLTNADSMTHICAQMEEFSGLVTPQIRSSQDSAASGASTHRTAGGGNLVVFRWGDLLISFFNPETGTESSFTPGGGATGFTTSFLTTGGNSLEGQFVQAYPRTSDPVGNPDLWDDLMSGTGGISAQNQGVAALLETGTTLTDSLDVARVLRAVADTGLTVTDSIAANPVRARSITDTGLTVSVTLASARRRTITDSGMSLSSSLPTSAPVLDNCTRADENPLSNGGQWSQPLDITYNGVLELSSDQIVKINSDEVGAWWNPQTFTDCVVYATIAVLSGLGSANVVARVVNPGGGSPFWAGYWASWDGAGNLSLFKGNTQAFSALAQGKTQAWAPGDQLALGCFGSRIVLWTNHEGAWTQQYVVNDSTYTSGYIGIYSFKDGTQIAYSSFGGGAPASFDTLGRQFTRSLTDTGLTESDSIAANLVRVRAVTDTGLTTTDSIAKSLTKSRALIDNGLDASPSTPIIDNFNRADENPLSDGGYWTASGDGFFPGVWTVASNQAAPTNSNRTLFFGSGSFTDCEAYVTSAASAGTIGVGVRYTDGGGTSSTGYYISLAMATGLVTVFRRSGGSNTSIFSASLGGPQSAGLKVALRAVGTRLEVWTNNGTGWALFGAVNDSTLVSGSLYLFSQSSSTRADDFGGGATTLLTDSVAVAPVLRLLTDTGLTISDSIAGGGANFPVTATDTGLTVSDSLVSLRNRAVTDTGLTLSDSLDVARVLRSITDTGLTVTDSISNYFSRTLTDTGIDGVAGVGGGIANSAEGGTNGVTPTTSDTGSGQPWDSVTAGTGAVLVYSNVAPAHGLLGYQIAVRGTSAQARLGWNYTALATAFGRVYVSLDSVPTIGAKTIQWRTGLAGVVLGYLQISTAMKVVVRNGADGATIFTSATVLQVGHTYRIEYSITPTGDGNSTVQVRIYDGDSIVALEDSGALVVAVNTGGGTPTTSGGVFHGIPNGATNMPSATGFLYLDDLVAGASTWPGPSGSSDYLLRQIATTAADTGLTVTDSLTKSAAKTLTDTGLTVTDLLASLRLRSLTDTGATVSDAIQKSKLVLITDTGVTVTTTLASLRTRPITDTGLTTSDSIAATRVRAVAITDTGATISDAVASARTHFVTDTGLTESDALASSKNRPITDVGLALSESIQKSAAHFISDTGATVADTTATLRNRAITDTGLTVSDTTQKSATHFLTDTGATITDSVARTSFRFLADTGLTVTDSTATSRTHLLTDTGLTTTDSIAKSLSRSITDTGVTITDSTATSRSRFLTDTGLTVTDSIQKSKSAAVTDTGATITTSLASLRLRPITDTGLTESDTTQKSVAKSITDTGATVADAIASAKNRPITDVGLSLSESIASTRVRALSDTGLAESDTLATVRVRALTDTGLTVTDTTQKSVAKFITDTGLTTTDTIARTSARAVTDTGLSVSDSTATSRTRFLADTGATITDSTATLRLRSLTDTGLTQSDSLAKVASKTLTDTGLTVTDTLAHTATRPLTDTGATVTDSTRKSATHFVTDTGATITDSISAAKGGQISVSDIGLTLTESISKAAAKFLTDTGLTVSDALAPRTIRLLTDTGATITPVTVRPHSFKFITDAGLAITDTLAPVSIRAITDVGLTVGITYIGETGKAAASGSSSTLVVPVTNAPASGHRLVARIGFRASAGTTVTSVTDTRGNTWTLDGANDNGSGHAALASTTMRAGQLTTADTITVHLSGATANGIEAIVDEWANLGPVDQTATGSALTTARGAGTVATNVGDDGLIAAFGGNGAETSFTPDPAWTNLVTTFLNSTAGTGSFVEGQYRIVSVTGNYTAPATGGFSGTTEGVVVAYQGMPDSLVLLVTRADTDTGLTVIDSLAIARVRSLTDTGLTLTDSTQKSATKLLTDTGMTEADAIASAKNRPITDVGLALSESIASTRVRALTDTGASITDSLATTRVRSITDTGLTITDSTQKSVSKSITDTGLTLTDSLAAARVRTITLTDTGLTVSDSLATRRVRALTDTGLTITDVISTGGQIALLDTGLTLTESIRKTASKSLTDTGLTITDAIGPADTRRVTDTGLTVSDALTTNRIRSLTDTGASITDSIRKTAVHFVADTGLTLTDSISGGKGASVTLTDTGATVSDATQKSVTHFLAATGLSITDSIGPEKDRALTDTGLAISDAVAPRTVRPRTLTDTGLSLTDSTQKSVVKFVSATGLTITDSVSVTTSGQISLTDTGLTISDSTRTARARFATDTGLAFSDTLTSHFQPGSLFLTDTGLTFSDTLVRSHALLSVFITDTGLTITDSIPQATIPGFTTGTDVASYAGADSVTATASGSITSSAAAAGADSTVLVTGGALSSIIADSGDILDRPGGLK